MKRLPPLDPNAARVQWVEAERVRRQAAVLVTNAPGACAARRRELLMADALLRRLHVGRRHA